MRPKTRIILIVAALCVIAGFVCLRPEKNPHPHFTISFLGYTNISGRSWARLVVTNDGNVTLYSSSHATASAEFTKGVPAILNTDGISRFLAPRKFHYVSVEMPSGTKNYRWKVEYYCARATLRMRLTRFVWQLGALAWVKKFFPPTPLNVVEATDWIEVPDKDLASAP